jgi:hypothetical protein
LFVVRELWDRLEDMADTLEEMRRQGLRDQQEEE